MVRLWNRLLIMDDNRITKKISLWSLQNENMWVTEIKNVFELLDLGICYESVSMCDLDSVKNKIHSLAVRNWEEEIIIKPKLRTYITLMITFETESYITNNISRRKRSLRSQFRSGILPIYVETGRFRNLPVDIRVYEICRSGEVENDKHFLCEYDVYCHFREELYTAAGQKSIEFMIMDKDTKFKFTMNNMWGEVSSFLIKAWDKRKATSYEWGIFNLFLYDRRTSCRDRHLRVYANRNTTCYIMKLCTCVYSNGTYVQVSISTDTLLHNTRLHIRWLRRRVEICACVHFVYSHMYIWC